MVLRLFSGFDLGFCEFDAVVEGKICESGQVVVLNVSTSGMVTVAVDVILPLFGRLTEEIKIPEDDPLVKVVLFDDVIVLSAGINTFSPALDSEFTLVVRIPVDENEVVGMLLGSIVES